MDPIVAHPLLRLLKALCQQHFGAYFQHAGPPGAPYLRADLFGRAHGVCAYPWKLFAGFAD